jgi:hypothetical protein
VLISVSNSRMILSSSKNIVGATLDEMFHARNSWEIHCALKGVLHDIFR